MSHFLRQCLPHIPQFWRRLKNYRPLKEGVFEVDKVFASTPGSKVEVVDG